MYTRCQICGSDFPEGKVLEHLPRGDRVAYDLRRGRLWVVCRRCRRWSLIPLEARWEVLEEVDRLFSAGRNGPDPVRFVSKTENVALYSLGPLEIVRVFQADRIEEAEWRYGTRLPAPAPVAAELPRAKPWLRATGAVWRGRRECPGCGFGFSEIPYSDRNILIVGPPEGDGSGGEGDSDGAAPTLTRRCPRCKDAVHGGLRLRGMEAELVLFRLLAFEYHTGAPMDRIRSATRLVQDPDGPATLVRILSEHGRPMGDLPPLGTLALEMVVSEARELTLSKMEVRELEFRWRREEELAELMDGELTPVPFLERLVMKVRGGP